MGVDIPWKVFTETNAAQPESIAKRISSDKGPCSEVEHDLILEQISNKIVAIDATQWIFQSQHRARITAALGNEADEHAVERNAISFILGKAQQLLCYGAHPVLVFDGQPPAAKGNAFYGSSKFELQKRAVKDIIDACGLPCIVAPGEGEAMCAALNSAGLVDAVVTTDICDCFAFGARTVLRDVHLDYRKPPDSYVTYMAPADLQRWLGLEDGGREAMVTLAILIGSDYNRDGLKGVGCVAAVAGVRALLDKFAQRQPPGAARGDRDFLAFVADQLEAPPDPVISQLTKCTGCKCCGHEGGLKGTRKQHGNEGCAACGTLGSGGCVERVGAACECAFHRHGVERALSALLDKARTWLAADVAGRVEMPPIFSGPRSGGALEGTFADHFRAVSAVFERERARAEASVQHYTRADMMWRSRPQAALLARLLERRGFSHRLGNGANDVLGRVAKIELEWSLRAGEGAAGNAFRITAVKKDKEWPKAAATANAAGGPVPVSSQWQLLVDIERLKPAAAAHRAGDGGEAERIHYDEDKAAKDPGNRTVRRALVERAWPTVMASFQDAQLRKAGKGSSKGPAKKAVLSAPVAGQSMLQFRSVKGTGAVVPPRQPGGGSQPASALLGLASEHAIQRKAVPLGASSSGRAVSGAAAAVPAAALTTFLKPTQPASAPRNAHCTATVPAASQFDRLPARAAPDADASQPPSTPPGARKPRGRLASLLSPTDLAILASGSPPLASPRRSPSPAARAAPSHAQKAPSQAAPAPWMPSQRSCDTAEPDDRSAARAEHGVGVCAGSSAAHGCAIDGARGVRGDVESESEMIDLTEDSPAVAGASLDRGGLGLHGCAAGAESSAGAARPLQRVLQFGDALCSPSRPARVGFRQLSVSGPPEQASAMSSPLKRPLSGVGLPTCEGSVTASPSKAARAAAASSRGLQLQGTKPGH